jgi:hypothetical protein
VAAPSCIPRRQHHCGCNWAHQLGAWIQRVAAPSCAPRSTDGLHTGCRQVVYPGVSGTRVVVASGSSGLRAQPLGSRPACSSIVQRADSHSICIEVGTAELVTLHPDKKLPSCMLLIRPVSSLPSEHMRADEMGEVELPILWSLTVTLCCSGWVGVLHAPSPWVTRPGQRVPFILYQQHTRV